MVFFREAGPEKIDGFGKLFADTKVLHVRHPLADVDELGAYYVSLAGECGMPLVYEEDPVTGEIHFNKWTEIRYRPESLRETYKHSNRSQPLHTDYGYFSFEMFASFFYCVTQAEFGGATTFIDADTVVSVLQAADPVLLADLGKQKIRFGRKNNPIGYNEDYILAKDSLGWRINWNYYRALEDTEHAELVERFKHFVDTQLEKSGELKEVKLQPGEAVFFQDRRVLHGRNSFLGDRQLNKGAIAESVPAPILAKFSRPV